MGTPGYEVPQLGMMALHGKGQLRFQPSSFTLRDTDLCPSLLLDGIVQIFASAVLQHNT